MHVSATANWRRFPVIDFNIEILAETIGHKPVQLVIDVYVNFFRKGEFAAYNDATAGFTYRTDRHRDRSPRTRSPGGASSAPRPRMVQRLAQDPV
jgi:hypothetical protein